jgi:REP-associated tyrosine transposase
MAVNMGVVAGNVPYHVIQRGSRRQPIFYEDVDYQAYLDILAQSCQGVATQVLGYCLLPNRVHLILVPTRPGGLRGVITKTHRLYKRRIDFRRGSCKRLWQEPLWTFPLKNNHLSAAVRYIELEPVRSNLAKTAADYSWSSTRAHLAGADDALVTVRPLLKLVPDWEAFLAGSEDAGMVKRFKRQTRKGRFLGGMGLSPLLKRMSWKKRQPVKTGFLKQKSS